MTLNGWLAVDHRDGPLLTAAVETSGGASCSTCECRKLIRCRPPGTTLLLERASMWEIDSDNVGNGRSGMRSRPRSEGSVASPPRPTDKTGAITTTKRAELGFSWASPGLGGARGGVSIALSHRDRPMIASRRASSSPSPIADALEPQLGPNSEAERSDGARWVGRRRGLRARDCWPPRVDGLGPTTTRKSSH